MELYRGFFLHNHGETIIDIYMDSRVLRSFNEKQSSPVTNLHLRGFLATTDGIVLKRELVFPDDSPAVLVTDVCDDVHVWGPHLKLSLPVNDGGQGGTHQEWTFRMTLENEHTSV